MFSWNKKQWEADKIVFLVIILLYTSQKTFSQNMPWYYKYSRNLVIFVIFWKFSSIFLKGTFGWISWLNKARNDKKVANKCYMAKSKNTITSEVYRNILMKKK